MFTRREKKGSEVILTAGQRQLIAVKEMIAYYMESRIVHSDFAAVESDFKALLDKEFREQLLSFLIEDKQLMNRLIKYAFGEWPVFRDVGFITAQNVVSQINRTLKSVKVMKDAPLESKRGREVIKHLVIYKYSVATLINNYCLFWNLADEPDYQMYLRYLAKFLFIEGRAIESQWNLGC